MKKIALVFICLLLIGCQNEKDNTLESLTTEGKVSCTLEGKVGDYVVFGQYQDKPLLWQIIDVNEGKYTLWSDKIISFKSFDAAGSGNVFYTNDNVLLYDIDADFFNQAYDQASKSERIEAFGSGRWADSSLRAWLNAEGAVSYDNAPVETDIFPGKRAYNQELGFLSNFTESEKSYMQTITHKTLLTDDTLETIAGGDELHEYVWDKTPKYAVLNYDLAFYENVVDTVFLLSLKEVADIVQNQDLNYYKEAAEQAKDNFETKRVLNSFYEYWLRTPYPNRAVAVRTIHGKGNACSWIASSDEIGVVPAVVITGQNLEYLDGDGTFESPYIIR